MQLLNSTSHISSVNSHTCLVAPTVTSRVQNTPTVTEGPIEALISTRVGGGKGGGPKGSLSIQSQRRGMTMAQGYPVTAGVAGEVSSVLAGDQAGDQIRPFPGSPGSVHSLLEDHR